MKTHRAKIWPLLLRGAAISGLVACSKASSSATTLLPTGAETMVVTIIGLPAGVSANVTVTGGGLSPTQVPSTTTLSNLAVGTYTVTAATVIAPGTFTGISGVIPTEPAPVTFTPVVDSASGLVTLDSAASATIAYTSPPAPEVSVSVSNQVAMTGQGILVSWNSTGATACYGSGDGAWAQQPHIATSGSQTIVATGGAGQLSYFSVTCVGPGGGSFDDRTVLEQSNAAAGTGDLAVFTYGLPVGIATGASIAVVGQAAAATGLWTGLAPGSYTVTAATVVANGKTYVPTPSSQAVRVSADSESDPLVTYTSTSPTAPTATLSKTLREQVGNPTLLGGDPFSIFQGNWIR